MTADAHFGHDADSVLGGYREWQVNGALADLCEAVWIYSAGSAPLPHRIVPDGKPSLAVRLRRNDRREVNHRDLIVSGGLTQSVWYEPEPHEMLIAVRLFPEAAGSIGIVPQEHANSLQAAPPRLAARLDELVDTARADRPGDAARCLADRLLGLGHRQSRRLEHVAASAIRGARGRMSISKLCAGLEIGERHLRRCFLHATGLTPKQYSRMMRHLAAISMADKHDRPAWADIAIAAGYVDQSHMIRDAQALSGASPARLHAERRRESELSNTGAN